MQTAEELPVDMPKRKVGRPSKYTPEVIRKAEEYLTTWQDYGHKIPSVAGLSQLIDVSRERIAIWGQDKNKTEFSRILKKLQAIQESKLLDNGLDGTFNSAITKLCLSKHGYHDNPQANQGNSGITVQVNRGGVVLKSGGQTLEVQTEAGQEGTTLDHKPD